MSSIWCAECGAYVGHDAWNFHPPRAVDRTSIQSEPLTGVKAQSVNRSVRRVSPLLVTLVCAAAISTLPWRRRRRLVYQQRGGYDA